MPSICEFLGMMISMYWGDHPPPHFHVRYGDMRACIDIRTGALIEGDLPRKKLRKIEEWRKLHIDELLENWDLIIKHDVPHKVKPL